MAALCDIAIKVIRNSAAAPLLGDFEYQYYITLVVTLWYIFTELGLIIENAGKLGAPISDWLAKGIAKLRDKTDGNIEKTVFKEKDE